jgi:hypothetical protein
MAYLASGEQPKGCKGPKHQQYQRHNSVNGYRKTEIHQVMETMNRQAGKHQNKNGERLTPMPDTFENRENANSM